MIKGVPSLPRTTFAKHEQIRLLHVLDGRFAGYADGGLLDDAKLGLAHPRSW